MIWHLGSRVLTLGARPLVMGIVNVTPDSFSDGGRFLSVDAAVRHARDLIAQGADLLDVGGESTRPGAAPVDLEEELNRVVPVVEALAKETVPISIDTSKAEVARRCLERGARIVNDVTALTGDPDMPAVARAHQAGVVLMHMQGTPATMQIDPRYGDVVAEVRGYLEERMARLTAAGLRRESIAVDPGIGFGKRKEHNLALLARLEALRTLGRPICLGVSRKGLLGSLLQRPVDQRLAGSLAVVCHAMTRGVVDIVRVHDVQETRDAIETIAAIGRMRQPPADVPADPAP